MFEKKGKVFSIEDTSTPIALAREIFSEQNYFGVEDAKEFFGITIPNENGIGKINFPKNELIKLSQTGEWILALVPNISIFQMTEKVGIFRNLDDNRYHLRFSQKKDSLHWEIVKRSELAHSTSLTYSEQIDLLADDEEVPTARILIYISIIAYFKNGEILFNKTFVRSSEKVSNYRVLVAQTEGGEITIGGSIASNMYKNVGLAVAKSLL